MPIHYGYLHDRPLEVLATPYRGVFDTNMLISPETAEGTPWGRYTYSETSPLLKSQMFKSQVSFSTISSPAASLFDEESVTEAHDVDSLAERRPTWYGEAKTIARWSAPLIVTYLLQRSIHLVSVFAVGRIGPTELGAVSLGTVTASILGNNLIQGLATGLDTLAAQAYGSGNKHMVGLYTQRMVMFMVPLMVPMMVMWWYAEGLLMLILPDPEVVALTGLYLRIMSLRIPAFVLFECGKRYVQAQGMFGATTLVLLIGAPLNAVLMWFLVWRLNWGFVGAPIAITISENLMPVLLFLYVWLIDGSQCWGGFSKRAFTNWGPMVRLSLPGMLMNMAEFSVVEVLTLASAQFGSTELAAQSAVVTIVTITYNVFLPTSVAASTRVANWVGAGAINAARMSAKVTLVLSGILLAFIVVVQTALRERLPVLFTRDPDVARIIIAVLPIATCMQIFDASAVTSHGLLRGIGRQELAGYFNIGAYYLVAIPISLSTAFYLDWEIQGLWVGFAAGLFLVAAFEFWWFFRSDWGEVVEKAMLRNESD